MALRVAACALCIVLALTGAAAQVTSTSAQAPARETNAPALAPQEFVAPTPGPSFNNTGCPTVLQYLQFYSSNFSQVLDFIAAADQSTGIMANLSNPASSITMFAPTNTGMNASLSTLTPTASRPAAVERSAALTLRILQYALLPTPITPSAFKNGNSFNTDLITVNGLPEVVAVVASTTQGVRLVDQQTRSTTVNRLNNNGVQVCESVVYSLEGLLLPSSLAA